jgi:hypothetical protein
VVASPMLTYLELTAAIFHPLKLKYVEVIIEMSFDQLINSMTTLDFEGGFWTTLGAFAKQIPNLLKRARSKSMDAIC